MSKSLIPKPAFRRLRGYSFDPSLSVQLETVLFNETVFKIEWEECLEKGPVGEYLEIVDYDPASKCFYEPINLSDPYILAQDGLTPSESNPQFHQQMVYAVAMTTIQNFERALGRKTLWSSYREKSDEKIDKIPSNEFYQRLRVYPHALRQPNAYYSPTKKALLFGYFPASSNAPGEQIPNGIVFTCLSHDIIAHEITHALLDGMHRRFIEDSHPDTLAFHEAFADIVALFQHFSFPEVLRQQIAKTRGDLASQSLLGQLAQQFGKATGQYGALRDAIGGFDKAENRWKPYQPNPNDYQTVFEPHARGAILVAAVFEAFISIYKTRVADLLRIASNGTGILTPGELHPDLVNRLSREAAKTAQHVLNMCIRALDYCPPVDVTFGDYLRAIVTADIGLVPDDDLGYRVAFIESFRRRGIYPRDIRTLSEESLCWESSREDAQQGIFRFMAANLRSFVHQLTYLDEVPDFSKLENVPPLVKNFLIGGKVGKWESMPKEKKDLLWLDVTGERESPKKKWGSFSPDEKKLAEKVLWQSISDRERIYWITRAARRALSKWLKDYKLDAGSEDTRKFEEITGLYLFPTPENEPKVEGIEINEEKYVFEVHSFRATQRIGPDENTVNEVIITLTQRRQSTTQENSSSEPTNEPHKFDFRGGCTLILDLKTLKLKYVIKKLIDDSDGRLSRQLIYRTGGEEKSLRATYFGELEQNFYWEPFAFLHSEL